MPVVIQNRAKAHELIGIIRGRAAGDAVAAPARGGIPAGLNPRDDRRKIGRWRGRLNDQIIVVQIQLADGAVESQLGDAAGARVGAVWLDHDVTVLIDRECSAADVGGPQRRCAGRCSHSRRC